MRISTGIFCMVLLTLANTAMLYYSGNLSIASNKYVAGLEGELNTFRKQVSGLKSTNQTRVEEYAKAIRGLADRIEKKEQVVIDYDAISAQVAQKIHDDMINILASTQKQFDFVMWAREYIKDPNTYEGMDRNRILEYLVEAKVQIQLRMLNLNMEDDPQWTGLLQAVKIEIAQIHAFFQKDVAKNGL